MRFLLAKLLHQFYKVSVDSFIEKSHLPPASSTALSLDAVDSVQNRNVIELVELSGIEPLTPCVQGRCSPS